MPNHYKVLGISPSASYDEIAASYWDLKPPNPSKTHRTIIDLTGSKPPTRSIAATAKLDAIEKAWKILSDPASRRAYDAELARKAKAPAKPDIAARAEHSIEPRACSHDEISSRICLSMLSKTFRSVFEEQRSFISYFTSTCGSELLDFDLLDLPRATRFMNQCNSRLRTIDDKLSQPGEADEIGLGEEVLFLSELLYDGRSVTRDVQRILRWLKAHNGVWEQSSPGSKNGKLLVALRVDLGAEMEKISKHVQSMLTTTQRLWHHLRRLMDELEWLPDALAASPPDSNEVSIGKKLDKITIRFKLARICIDTDFPHWSSMQITAPYQQSMAE